MTDASGGKEGGFSLTEVMVVLAIVSLMASFVFVLVSQFQVISKKTDQLTDQAALQKTANYIARLLESAEPVPMMDADEKKQKFIDGNPHNITFHAIASGGVSRVSFAKVILKSDNLGIVENIEEVSSGDIGANRSSYQISPPGIEMTLSYLRPIENGTTQDRWSDVWQEERMPRAIAISLTQVNADKRVISVETIADLDQ